MHGAVAWRRFSRDDRRTGIGDAKDGRGECPAMIAGEEAGMSHAEQQETGPPLGCGRRPPAGCSAQDRRTLVRSRSFASRPPLNFVHVRHAVINRLRTVASSGEAPGFG